MLRLFFAFWWFRVSALRQTGRVWKVWSFSTAHIEYSHISAVVSEDTVFGGARVAGDEARDQPFGSPSSDVWRVVLPILA